MSSSFEERLAAIEERNARVSSDKAWETSWFRRGMIAGITYIFAVILLTVLGERGALQFALVPVAGYVVSTFSLPPAKALWIKRRMLRQWL
jgi:preprotein translocase subunit SecF